jgi:hypothetical protein
VDFLGISFSSKFKVEVRIGAKIGSMDSSRRFLLRSGCVVLAQGAPSSFNPQRRGWFRPEFMVGRVLALRGFPQDYLGEGRVKSVES